MIYAIPEDLPNCPQCNRPIRLATPVRGRAQVEPCGHYISPVALQPAHVDESDSTTDRIATDSGTPLVCDVKGCDASAAVRVYPTNGKTNHAALRCWDCLDEDRARDHFAEWRRAIERDRLETDGGHDVDEDDETVVMNPDDGSEIDDQVVTVVVVDAKNDQRIILEGEERWELVIGDDGFAYPR